MDQPFDVVIIGAGPGGYVAAIRAAQLGLRTALVEKQEVGGVCLNRGCIPTKAMLRSVQVLEDTRRGEEFGVLADNVRLDYSRVLSRRDQVVANLRRGVEFLLKSNGVQLVRGTAQLTARDRVEVRTNGATTALEARNVVIATGSEPAMLPVPGASGPGIIDSDGALLLDRVPHSILVVGGGAVGTEWATIFSAFGAKVTIVEMMPTLLPLEDEDIGRILARSFSRRGIQVYTGSRLVGLSPGPNGGWQGTITTPDGREEQVSAEFVLVAVGRKPLTRGLNLEAAGVRTGPRGFIEVDNRLQTNVPGVYAIGDVTGKYLLAHVASHQGIVAVENIAGRSRSIDYKAIPSVTFTHPEVATVGLSEAKAREQGYEVKTGQFPFSALGRAHTYGDTEGMVKIVADAKYGEVLGVHIIGPSASDLIPEATLGLNLEVTLEDIAETVHAHPTFPEAVMEAAAAALGRPLHIPPRPARTAR